MYQILLLAGLVIAICVLSNRMASKLPVPSLLVFIALGMLCGVDGPLHISFDDYALTEAACCTGLLFIMFYGGFNANVRQARPVAVQAILLSTVGVLITSILVGAFCRFVLGYDWLVGLLVGSVIASTDAASVFNVLRSSRLSLRDGTDSLLEIESGSNDPMSYLLTIILAAILAGEDINVAVTVVQEIALGLAFGLGIGKLAELVLDHFDFEMDQGETIFLIATAIISYALPSVLHGNGFLSVYLCGMWLGNVAIPHKRDMARTFDVVTEVCQIGIFFLLGLLVTPSRLQYVLAPAIAVFVFIGLVGRPLAALAVLAPFGASLAKVAVSSWAGLRGAASVVFALFVVTAGVELPFNIFDLVFVVVILSLVIQGSLLPWFARRVDMVDPNANVMRTFNDFQEETDLSLVRLKLDEGHPYVGRELREITLPRELIVVVILREGAQKILPGGSTMLAANDVLVCAAPSFEDRENLTLRELSIGPKHRWAGRLLRELPDADGIVIVMLQRGSESIVPNGSTRIEAGDIAFVAGTPKMLH